MSLRLPASRGRKVQVDTSLAIVNIVLLLIFYFLLAGQDPKFATQLELATTSTLSPGATPSERAINEDVRRKGVKNAEIGYGHIGALSGWGESVLVVRPDSPASRAGILPGRQILSIDGQPSWMHEKQAQQ